MQEIENTEVEGITKTVYEENNVENSPPKEAPKDKYLLCYILFFLLGIVHFLPVTFLAAANNFWMEKFRNTTLKEDSPDDRTWLQAHFASFQTIVNTVPSIILGYWNVRYGHRFKMISRITITLVVENLVFYLLTAFIKTNTDSYQVVFFAITLACSGILAGANTVNILTSSILYPRFPHTYMKICLIGEGVSGILGDLLNIISVAIFDDLSSATLTYFLVGSFMITITLILLVYISRTTFFRHCLTTLPENTKKKETTRKEIGEALKKIWPSVLIFFVFGLGLAATHTSVTSLVVSEGNNTTTWSTKFFVPVVTFLLSDIWILVGRSLSSYLPWRIPEKMLCILAIVRTVVIVPAVWLCNAKPRHHLPVVFSHDWEYALIMAILMLTNGYLINTAVINIPRNMTKEESEVAFNVFSLFMGVAQVVASPIGMFIVNIL